jgi:hypothetical protein
MLRKSNLLNNPNDNPITELMKEAMRTSHDACSGPEGCIHHDAVLANMEQITDELRSTVLDAAQHGQDPIFAAYFKGLHEGYRLAALQLEPAKESMN